MKPQPTGHIKGNDLIMTRRFDASIDDVWASVTESERTALWFGPWEGQAGQGRTVRLQLVHEKDQPWTNVTIEACEAPRHLIVTTKDDFGEWLMELTLTGTDDGTELRFSQHLSDPALAGDIGPGWEYYLDMLVAARNGTALPSFDDYYPAMKEHYLRQG
jgi:uncharacterized protein YndB with AHSA1/START domain